MPEATRGGRFPHLIRAVLARPWAVDAASAEWGAIIDILSMRANGERLSEDEIRAHIEAANRDRNGARAGGGKQGNVAVIPLYGMISPRVGMASDVSSPGTTAEGFSNAVNAAVSDPEVDALLIDIDSPGGNVEGITEAHHVIREARAQKPVAAIAHHNAMSAAYWLAAAADELTVTPSGAVGSIGVITAHQDLSESMKQRGIATRIITAGKYKGEGNPYGPLDDDAAAEIQRRVDAVYSRMVTDIARGRGTGVDAVRNDFGQGRTVAAKEALDAGMVDRIDTFSNTLRRVSRGDIQRRGIAPAAPPAAASVVIGEAVGGVDEPEEQPGDTGQEDTDGASEPATVRPYSAAELDLIEAGLRSGHGWLGSH